MSESTKIEWADASWNPVTGCTPISIGCDHCYARKMAVRLAGRCGYPSDDPFRPGTFHEDKLHDPLRWKKPKRIFVCSMGDLFHNKVSFIETQLVLDTIEESPQHTFLMLTKRPDRMKQFFTFNTAPFNVWLGVTVCNQAEADEKIPVLLKIPAAGRFVSVEPMLGHVDLDDFLYSDYENGCTSCSMPANLDRDNKLNWVICGGETGPNARPLNPGWVKGLHHQCTLSQTPFFFKQWNKKGDCLLDGKEHKQFPKNLTPAGVPANNQ